MTNFNDKDWEDCGSYWLHKYPQLSPEWFMERKKRLTATYFSAVANPSFYQGHDDVIKRYSGKPIKKSLQDQIASNLGITREPDARKWYEKEFNITIKEVGLAVPKWDNRIGASLDGEVNLEGAIEIKSPGRMYYSIRKYLNDRKQGWLPENRYHDHIYLSHYDQMQGGMAITGKKWCDYIVYTPAEEYTFVERIYFDQQYWELHLYPIICKFLDQHSNLFIKI